MILLVRRLVHAVRRRVRENLDLLATVAVFTVLLPVVPPGYLLDRADLAPWLAVAVAAAAAIRDPRLGSGAHPMLTPRTSAFGARLRHAARVATPLTLFAWFEVGRTAAVRAETGPDVLLVIGIAVVATVATIGAFALGGDDGRTGWNPTGAPGGFMWGLVYATIGVLCVACGFLSAAGPPPWTVVPAWLGLVFLCTGLAVGRAREVRQRRVATAGLFLPFSFRHVLALVGPTFTLLSLQGVLWAIRGDVLSFEEAWIAVVVVAMWAAVVWPPRVPIGVTCILHEVVPFGGNDRATEDGAAVPFDRAPEGALRFHPLRTTRIQSMHPWLVPVRAARIAELDDPILPLWPPPTPRPASHILGDAAFEPDPLTAMLQWDEITIHLGSRHDVGALTSGDVQTRRLVVLRPFPVPGSSRRTGMTTWRWESAVPAGSYQLLDATVDSATIRHGDVLVMSLEGVARAFEVEFGVPVYTLGDAVDFRPPQVRDYIGVGA